MHNKIYSSDNPKKPVRTISGVTPLTVVLKPKKCDHGTCIFCPGGEYTPQSYTDKSPAIMRAMALDYDPYEQTKIRLENLHRMGHPTDKIELIILGGTFLQYPLDYQYDVIKRSFDALNGRIAKDLAEAKKWNETAEHRCVAMCIENRPDNCSKEEIERMLEFGCTRVEIGVQILDDKIYKKIHRGHTVKDVVEASKNLKNAGFKLGYHIMPGLPYSTPENDIKLFKKVFSDKRFRPDQLKIYPCQIVKDSPLEKMYERIGYTPYSQEQTKDLLNKMMGIIPEYCRVMRVMREIPKEKMVLEPLKLDLRKDVEDNLRKTGVKVKEIRMREIGFNDNISPDIKLKITEYGASDGKEYFLQIVNEDNILFGLLRLRIFWEDMERDSSSHHHHPDPPAPKMLRSAQSLKNINIKQNLNDIKNSDKLQASDSESANKIKIKKAIVRELHVYGQALKLGHKSGEASQHQGLGKWLMEEAEKITKENGIKELAVISGVGVREYYRKLGYILENVYVVKKLL